MRPSSLQASPPDRSPPHSAEAEEHVIACCLLDGSDTIERCVEARITSESFYFPANCLLFGVILELYQKSPPVTLEILVEELKSRRQLDAVGGWPYLMQVTGKIPTTAHAGYFIEKVRKYESQRLIIRITDKLREGISDPALDSEVLDVRIRQTLDALQTSTGGQRLGLGVTAAELCSNPPAVPVEIIAGVLYAAGTMMLSGPSKAHKTFTFLDLGLSVASGSPWLGFRTARAPVLYLNFELAQHSFARRIAAITKAKGIPPPADFRAFTLRGKSVTVALLETYLPRLIQKHSARVVIADPWYKVSAASGAEENSNDGQARILADLERIVTGTGAALIIGHHFAKGDASSKNSIDRAAGAGAMARWGDVIATLTPHEEEGAMALELHLRDFPPFPPSVVRWEHPLWRRDDSLDPTKLRKVGRSDAHPASAAMSALKDGMTTREWADALGWSSSTFDRKRKQLLEAGKVSQTMGVWRRNSP